MQRINTRLKRQASYLPAPPTLRSHLSGKPASFQLYTKPSHPQATEWRGRGRIQGERDSSSAGLFTDSTNNHESEIQATRCFPTNKDQLGPFSGVLKDFGTGGGTLRESYHKAYKTRPQVQTASFLDLGLPYKVLGLRTWEGGHTARWP